MIVIGCDPEVFVKGPDGEFVSAHGMIPGTKARPLEVKDGMVQVDGMALEFGVDPCSTADEFVEKIRSVMSQLQEMLPEGHTLSVTPIATFSQEVMDQQPEEALELGCDPDFNAYTVEQNPRPNAAGLLMRSAGGHVHVGFGTGFDVTDRKHLETCAVLAAELDWFLGVPSLAWDKDNTRRRLYGAPGAFRAKGYGMEYRSLSNQWLKSEETVRFVFNQTVRAVENLKAGKLESIKRRKFFGGSVNVLPKSIISQGWPNIGTAVYEEMLNVQ